MRDRETSTSPTAKILVMTLELDAQHHDGVGCGEPKNPYFEAVGSIVTREFVQGMVEIDLAKQKSVIECAGKTTWRGAL